ncbi:MAG: hypothetical protein K2W95_28820 [Candidatus Obscuribacterales bacterium]|nr:hypothetical protein [Candidatus Obscuribacterales bacterium]
MFKTGQFDSWKAEVVEMLTQLAIEKAEQNKLESQPVKTAIGTVVAAQSFKMVILTLETLVPLDTTLRERVDTLQAADALRIYLDYPTDRPYRCVAPYGGCDSYLRDAYAECVTDVHATRQVVLQVQAVKDALGRYIGGKLTARDGGVLDDWQYYLYRLSILNQGWSTIPGYQRCRGFGL